MKLWKGATFAFVLCAATLSAVLVRNLTAIRDLELRAKNPLTSLPTSRPFTPSEPTPTSPPVLSEEGHKGGLHRKIRSTGSNMNSILSEFSMMLQSFTEGELQSVVGTLLDRKNKRDRTLSGSQTRRTKRAHRSKPCALRRIVLTVNDLGLGFKSDETIQLRYCSGSCERRQENYDLVMKNLVKTVFHGKSRKAKISTKPCCRPTAFEKSIFFYGEGEYKPLHNVSAKHCECV